MNKIIKNFKNIKYGPAPEDDTEVINWIKKISRRKYSYRILFSSETIGTLSYIEKRLNILKKM